MAIQAGDIVYLIRANLAPLQKAMGQARGKFNQLGSFIKQHSLAIGAGMTAAGGVIVGALGASVNAWAKYGDEIAKASKRTGLTTETMSRLKHAAEQTGTGIESVETGVKRMASFLDDGRRGLSTTTDAMTALGLTMDDFTGKTPEQSFSILAEAIRQVPDPLQQSALAQDVFGRSGTQLLPLINEGAAGLKAYGDEAERLGLVLDKDAAAKAEKFTDTMDELNKAFQGAMIAIGPLIADLLIPLAEYIRDTTAAMVQWTSAHPALTKVLLSVAGAIGGVMLVLGPMVIAIPALSAALPALGVALTAATGPFGVITVAVGALLYALWYFRDEIYMAIAPAIDYIVERIKDFERAIEALKRAFDFSGEFGWADFWDIMGFLPGGGAFSDMGEIMGANNRTAPDDAAGALDKTGRGAGGSGSTTVNINVNGVQFQDIDEMTQEIGKVMHQQLMGTMVARGSGTAMAHGRI